MRDADFLKFLREEGRCRACQIDRARGVRWYAGALGRWIIDPMHGPVNGTSSKGPDDGAIPGCRWHHDEQHHIGWPAFEAKYGFLRIEENAVWLVAYTIWKEHLA